MRLAVACNRSNRYSLESGQPEDQFEEFDSPETVDAIAKAIETCGHTAKILEADSAFPAALKRGKFDFVFNIAEGLSGRCRESQVPAVCEMLGVPYSGSDAITLGVTLDKDLARRTLHGIVPMAGGRLIRSAHEIDLSGLTFPIFAKPNAEGSSKGIRNTSRFDSPVEAKPRIKDLLEEYRCPVLVEEFLPGLECTVGVIGNAPARVIGMMEIAPRNVSPDQFVYSLETKRDYLNQVEYHIPPRLPPESLRRIEELALRAYRGLECRDFSRIDVRLDSRGNPCFLEANPLPGLSPVKGDLVILSKASGLTYEQLISEILAVSFQRYGLPV